MSVIRVDRDGAVRTVTLSRPEKRNALNAEMLRGLHAAFHAPPGPEERVAVVRAEGPVFCAGLDLRERLGEGAPGEPAPSIEAALHGIAQYPLPVVAVVQGDAIAGGNELALHCDLIVASAAAQFGMSLAQIGLAPPWPLASKLLDVAGPAVTREILLLGDPVPAERLYAWGIVARLAEPDDLDAAAQAVIDRLAANAPLALRAIKRTINRAMSVREAVPHHDIDAEIAAVRASADAREGIAARLERRAAAFEGR